MNEQEQAVFAATVMGLEMCIVHIFNCLDHKNVMARADAMQSLAKTAFLMAPTNALAARIVQHVVNGLQNTRPAPNDGGGGQTLPKKPRRRPIPATWTVLDGGKA
jgi:hypothetical protein